MPPINLETEEVASWIKVLLNQEQVCNPNRKLAVAARGIFITVVLNKHKLHNLIKIKICILTTTIKKKKKTRKYIKFTIAFYEFQYFEIVA